ncbi:hypothetical protein PR048_013100 [Dryococelus australis]|uniref:Endonuclease/exonuclease/phosphatase domain-containing protein n=1 Tax=Dryococelus australis TaxID=614101 RepID=A0ABQ9HR77_9NEOP|nr:hypothetical protein PR048_013100 [Dryococelus australis]
MPTLNLKWAKTQEQEKEQFLPLKQQATRKQQSKKKHSSSKDKTDSEEDLEVEKEEEEETNFQKQKPKHITIMGNTKNQNSHQQDKEIKILLWIANVLRQRGYVFQKFMEDEAIDISSIAETKLSRKTRYTLPRHLIYRKDRPMVKGGATLIAIKKNIMQTPIGSQQDSTVVMIPTQIGDMVITALYSPPKSKVLKENLQDIIQKAPNYIIGGELNSKSPAWGCKQ